MTEINMSIVENHKQLYKMSCIPSAIELVLKLLRKRENEYLELQNQWKNKHDGSFRDYDGYLDSGIIFHQINLAERGPSFPIEELFGIIDAELKQDKYVIISLASNGGFHMYIIYEENNSEYRAVTKIGKRTEVIDDVKTRVRKIFGTDILVYEQI